LSCLAASWTSVLTDSVSSILSPLLSLGLVPLWCQAPVSHLWVILFFARPLAEVGLSEETYRADLKIWFRGGKIEAQRLRTLATLQDRSGTRRYLNDIYADYSGYVHSSYDSATADMSRDNLRYWYDGRPDQQKHKRTLLPDVAQGVIDAVPSFLSAIQRGLERQGATMNEDALTTACRAYVRLIELLTVSYPADQRSHIVATYTNVLRHQGFPVP